MLLRQIFLGMTVFFSVGAISQTQEGLLEKGLPSEISAQDIIQKFTAKEKEFKNARKRCTYRQVIKMEQLDGDKPVGEYQQVADVTLDQSGKKVKSVVFAPQPSISVSPEDQYDIESRLHFTLSTDELPEYNVLYQGKQQEDDLHTYVFDVAPKQIEKGKWYFEGRIWVDDQDFQIVKMEGKSVPDIHPKKRGKGDENLFPKFTTFREQIDGKYWYPTYSLTDDTLHFYGGDAHIKGTVKATDYKCSGAEVASDGASAGPGQKKSN